MGTAAGKAPKTRRGERTLRALLDSASEEFGSKGFHDASISGITARAGVATGTFYTWFDSKEAVFTALVRDLSARVRDHVAPAIQAAPGALAAERAGTRAFLGFAREHKEIYRIIDEAEFVDAGSWRDHYSSTAGRIAARLAAAEAAGAIAPTDDAAREVRAWAIMGVNVFLGLRYGVWSDEADLDAVADAAGALIAGGLASG